MTTEPDPTVSQTTVREASEPPPAVFSIGRGEPAGEAIRRILLEQVALTSWHLERLGEADEHVHEVRKATKRARAVLRLVRSALPGRGYTWANRVLRDVARDLSETRSSIVRVETFGALVGEVGSAGPDVLAVRAHLEEVATRRRAALRADPRFGADLAARTMEVRGSIERWEFPADLDLTAHGLALTYRSGREGMAAAYAGDDAVSFHRWRKQVKYLRHQMEVLLGSDVGSSGGIVEELEELGDGLGREHDLTDLETVVSGPVPAGVPPGDRAVLLGLLDRRRREIRAEVRALGEHVYDREPGVFVGDVRALVVSEDLS